MAERLALLRVQALRAFLLTAAMLLASCNESQSPFVPMAEPTADARMIAMVLGQTLRPDEGLSERVAGELSAVRDGYGVEIPQLLDLHPSPPWREDTVWLWMTEGAADSVRKGIYAHWDSLNEEQGATLLRVSPRSPSVLLQFNDMIHPRFMGTLYAKLPGVIWAGPDGKVGDWPNVYPLQRDAGRTYLFRAAGGDCPAGCTENEYWYFRFAGARLEFVGHWGPGGEPEPSWWAEAKENRDNLIRW